MTKEKDNSNQTLDGEDMNVVDFNTYRFEKERNNSFDPSVYFNSKAAIKKTIKGRLQFIDERTLDQDILASALVKAARDGASVTDVLDITNLEYGKDLKIHYNKAYNALANPDKSLPSQVQDVKKDAAKGMQEEFLDYLNLTEFEVKRYDKDPIELLNYMKKKNSKTNSIRNAKMLMLPEDNNGEEQHKKYESNVKASLDLLTDHCGYNIDDMRYRALLPNILGLYARGAIQEGPAGKKQIEELKKSPVKYMEKMTGNDRFSDLEYDLAA